jgi:uncharacterized protein (TIGR03118 family)
MRLSSVKFQVSVCLATCLVASGIAVAQQHYAQTNLVSDIPGLAAHTDKNLVNAWGIAFGSKSPFWVADNGTGVSTLYNADGSKVPLTVTIPPPEGGKPPSTPTGVVFNRSATDFIITANGVSAPAVFIFVSEDGTISGWNPTVNLHRAIRVIDNSRLGSVYKGLAISVTANGGPFLYATNFHDGTVEVYDTNFQLVNVFTDIERPAGYAPFGIRVINGKIYVTFAIQDEDKHDDVAGKGHGLLDIFNAPGRLLQRLVSHSVLNSPWGLALAPANFGKFSNALLVGNFGDGRISAFNPTTGAFLGSLRKPDGTLVMIDGLWTITFGNQTTPSNTLFFSAGPDGESHGLFGKLEPVP